MTNEEFKELLDKHARGNTTPQEEELINQWYESIGDKGFVLDDETKARTELRLWNKLEPQKDYRNSFFYNAQKMAAAILLLAAFGAALLTMTDRSNNTLVDANEYLENKFSQVEWVRNDLNTTQKLTLSDGTEVVLEPLSSLRFDKDFTTDKREVYLTGQAFFKVKRDTLRPFLVYANEVITKVLGTSFNIKAVQGDKEVTVVVKTGKVSVSSNTQITMRQEKEVILTPNQEVVYKLSDGKVVRKLVDIPEIILPKSALFKMDYDNAPVIELFDALQKNYGVEIKYDAEVLSDCILTTSMADEGLYQRIEVICKAIGAEYIRNESSIEIRSNGCK